MPQSLVFIIPEDKIQSKIEDIVTLIEHASCPKNLKIHLPTINATQSCMLGSALVDVHWQSLWLIIDDPAGNDAYFSLMFKTCIRGDHLFLKLDNESEVKSKPKRPISDENMNCSPALVFSKLYSVASPFVESVREALCFPGGQSKIKKD